MAASVSVYLAVLVFAVGLQILMNPSPCAGQKCNTSLFVFNQTVYDFSNCVDLSQQSASMAWNYHGSNSSLDLAFSGTAPSPSGWVGWGINPKTANAMVGSSVLIAFQSSVNGSNVLQYKLTSQVQTSAEPLVCTPVDITITSTAVEITGNSMSLFVSFKLPSNSTKLNHIWNRGSVVTKFQPQPHDQSGESLLTYKVIDMYSANTTTDQPSPPQYTLKRVHGIINTVAWGILLPIGAMVARYLRPCADPAWFYIHASFQTLGYLLGLTGWALGIRLQTLTHVLHRSHRNIGIALVALASLQVASLFLRPGKDHKIRKWWNVYHHALGYAILFLAIVNIFQGLNILEPGGHWRAGYAASLAILILCAVLLEIGMWIRYCFARRRS